MNIGISRVGQIAINARDIDRATAFYRDKLGLPLLFTAGKLAFFDCGGVRLMLDVAEKPEFDHPSSSRCRISRLPIARCLPAECASRTSPT